MKAAKLRRHKLYPVIGREMQRCFTYTEYIKRVNKPRRKRWVGHVARMGEMRNACSILVGKREGK
jgi:hypothetical protein